MNPPTGIVFCVFHRCALSRKKIRASRFMLMRASTSR
jgi:hypothetical protein